MPYKSDNNAIFISCINTTDVMLFHWPQTYIDWCSQTRHSKRWL